MSLKMMHFVFVSASIILALTLAIWCWVQYDAAGGAGYLLGAIGAFTGLGLLAPYALWVRHKLRDVGLW